MNTITLSSFWQFSLTLYKNELVQTTLIHFQNEFAANVNLALFCAMLNKHGYYLTKSQLRTLEQNVSDFSNQFTRPLRALRNTYKTKQGEINEYAQLKQKLLDAELLFEQQEHAVLIAEFTKLKSDKTLVCNDHTDNLALYESMLISPNSRLKTVKLTDLNQYLSSS